MDASDLLSFLAGVLVGAAGKYFADKYTDRRREQEAVTKSRKLFRKLASEIPQLIQEMATDYAGPDGAHVRELVILPSRSISYNSGGQLTFAYFEDEHPNLRGKFAMLENSGYVSELPKRNVPHFRVSEEFVSFLRTKTAAV